jgi:hypothetical protein
MLDIEWVEAETAMITVFLDSEDAALQFGKGFQCLFIVSRFGFCNGTARVRQTQGNPVYQQWYCRLSAINW